jgi:hypothetical protein
LLARGKEREKLNYGIYVLNVSITNDTEGELYTLEIKNTTPPPKEEEDKKKAKTVSHFASYTTTLSGRGLSKPLTVRLRKYSPELGVVKLTARVLGRLFRKHMDQLVSLPGEEEEEKEKEGAASGKR